MSLEDKLTLNIKNEGMGNSQQLDRASDTPSDRKIGLVLVKYLFDFLFRGILKELPNIVPRFRLPD
jgi:hypothetical protein